MLLNNKHYYNLPPEERKNLWKHYKKVYPNMGYTDMVKHFNGEVENYQFGGRTDYFDSDVKKFVDGGKTNTLEGDLISKVIMNRNKDKDFVKRAYAVGQYPESKMFTLPDPDEFNSRMTHKMSWGEDDKGQAYMFPEIMNPNNEAIKIPNQYADYITSEGYKKVTNIPIKKSKGGLIKKYEDGGTDKPKVNSKILSGLSTNIPKNRLEAESREEYKRMHPEIEAANFYNKIQKNIEQTSEIYQTGSKKGRPTGKGALEPSYPEMMLMPGSLPIKAASKLGKAAVFAAETLNPIGGMKEIIKPKVLKTINNIKKIKTKTDDFIYETKYKKQIESIPKIKYQLIQEINTPEGYKRLRKQGIDPKSFIDQLNNTPVTTKRNQGSWDDSMSINIDFNQLADLKKQGYNISTESVLDHEIAHRMQRGFNSKAVKKYNEAVKEHNERIKILNRNSLYKRPKIDEVPSYIVYSTPLDKKSAELLLPVTKNMKQKDADYFFEGTEYKERLPFLRETKREMKTKGYINSIYDEITPEITKKFLNENPGNRFAKFLEINQPLTHNRLSSLLNKTPIVAGATVVTNKLNEK